MNFVRGLIVVVIGSIILALIQNAFGITFPSVWASIGYNLVFGLTMVMAVQADDSIPTALAILLLGGIATGVFQYVTGINFPNLLAQCLYNIVWGLTMIYSVKLITKAL